MTDPKTLMLDLIEEGNEKCWACKVCTYRTKVRSNLIKHIQRRHCSTRFNCHLCTNSLGAEADRKEHYKRVHSLVLTYKEIRAFNEEQ